MHLFSDTASGRIASLPSPTDTLPNVQGKRMMAHTRHTRSPQPGDPMPNPSAVLYIALPHLHPALVEQDARRLGLALPEGVRSLWPGLPAMPEGTFAPETLPWNLSQGFRLSGRFRMEHPRRSARRRSLLWPPATSTPQARDRSGRRGCPSPLNAGTPHPEKW